MHIGLNLRQRERELLHTRMPDLQNIFFTIKNCICLNFKMYFINANKFISERGDYLSQDVDDGQQRTVAVFVQINICICLNWKRYFINAN